MRKIILTIIALFCLTASPVFAATTPNSVVTCQTPKNYLVQFLQGTDTAGTYKTLITAGANGTKINGLWMDNNDPSATHVVTCQVVNTAVKYGLVALTSIVSAGFVNGTPSQNLMSNVVLNGPPQDSDGNPFFFLNSGDTLQCTFATALTASDLLNVHAAGCDF